MTSRIYTVANRLRRKYHTSDPFELLDALHVVVKYSDKYGPTGLKGFTTVWNQTVYVVINSFLSEEEMRVVAAHELGHVVLHRPLLYAARAFQDGDIYFVTGKAEREANFLAADFLLSDEDVLEEMQEKNSDFFVTASALNIPAPFFAFKLYSMVERGFSMSVPVDLDSDFLAD